MSASAATARAASDPLASENLCVAAIPLESPVRLLHLSDLHFSANNRWDADAVLRDLVRCIAQDASEGLIPDLVAITGDLAFAGKREDYALALDWLDRVLWPALDRNGPEPLPRDRLLLVPGNHDVDRARIGIGALNIQDGQLAGRSQDAIAQLLQHAKEREILLERHADYLACYGDWLGQPQSLPWWQRRIDIRRQSLHIAGLDSAWMSGSDRDRGRLLLGRWQVNQTVLHADGEGADWRIALVHHPWDYLAEFDCREQSASIHLHRDLVLRGHLHENDVFQVLPPAPDRACLELAAGCVYGGSRNPNAFQWIELWPGPKRVRVLFRLWSRNAWQVDRNQPGCTDGTALFPLDAIPHGPNVAPHPSDQRQCAISLRALHRLCKEVIPAQIREVSRGKYLERLYVERAVAPRIEAFVDFETRYREQIMRVLPLLREAAAGAVLPRLAPTQLAMAEDRLASATDPALAESIIDRLRGSFCYAETRHALQVVDRLMTRVIPAELDLAIERAVAEISALPFLTRERHGELADILRELARASYVSGASRERAASPSEAFVGLFPSAVDERGQHVLAIDLLDELAGLVVEHGRRCLAIVDRAGRGKTNLACRLAAQVVERYPVILLSGQLELSAEFDLERHVQRELETRLPGSFADWMSRLDPELEPAAQWLFIVIDGINENRDLPLLARMLDRFLPKARAHRIKLIVTCRDIYWETFEPHFDGYLFGAQRLDLGLFDEAEWRAAAAAYFAEYAIGAELGREAEAALRNPLLLRFFCEANRGREIGFVENLRLVEVFDLYVERVARSIADALGLIAPRPVIEFLLSIARILWHGRSSETILEALGITPAQASRTDGVYSRVRAEGLVLEQLSGRYGSKIRTRFIYDEFMEYMIARTWLDDIEGAADPQARTQALIREAGQASESFTGAFGAVQFLDQILDESGRVVGQLLGYLGSCGDEVYLSNQFVMVRALESANLSAVDDAVMVVLDRLERLARPEIKARIAPLVLKLLESAPHDRQVQRIARRILEIDEETETPAPGGAKGTDGPDRPQPQPPMPGAQRPQGNGAWSARLWNESRQRSVPSQPEVPIPCLPPARFHYPDETKLNAIALLVASGSVPGQDLLGQAITRLGQGDLHSALRAIEALDGLADDAVLDALPRYVSEPAAEYRIYCAWLLRRRYGERAADALIGLLQDRDHRVHRYTLGLFESRRIEEPLLQDILNLIEDPEPIADWHLKNLLRVLGRRSQLDRPALAEVYGVAVAQSLRRLLGHPAGGVRCEALRAIMVWLDGADLASLLDQARLDPDPQVARLGRLLGLRTPSQTQDG